MYKKITNKILSDENKVIRCVVDGNITNIVIYGLVRSVDGHRGLHEALKENNMYSLSSMYFHVSS